MKGNRGLGPRGAHVAVAGVLALTGLALVGPAPATADTSPPPGSGMPATVSSVALPAPQISGGTGGAEGAQGGVVWATDMAGDIAFAGGNFTAATDPGAAAPEARGNLLAFDVTTGLLTDFAPQLNGQVLALAVSPDGGTLYVGGAFTEATVPDGDDADSEPDEVSRRRLAAYDIATGELLAFAPSVNADVAAVVATDDTVYAGGSFRGIGNVDRQYLAAFATDGTLLPWAPAATGGPVTSITANPAGTRIAVGGFFTALNGSSNPGYGLGMVDATSGANLPMAVNSVVRNGRPTGLDPDDETDGAITALATDGTNIYGTGFTYQSKEGGTLEGVFAASWNGGAITWINDCHGDAYDVAAVGDVVYAAGHTHYCENIDGVRQGPGGVGDYPYFRAIATSTKATGVVRWEPDQGRYQNYEGLPAPTMLGWYPSFNAGTFTGQAQGPWTVTGNDEYVVFGGEFTRVDNRANQGLVRFGIGSVPLPTGIDANGPQYFNDAYPIKLTSTETGSVRVSWGTNRDDDNENLTYRVQRRVLGETDVPAPLHTRTVFSRFWNPSTMTWTDTGVTPGTTYEYRVQARDPGGTGANSLWTSVTVATSGTDSDYVDAVYADEPTHWWRLGDGASTTSAAEDRVGVQQLTTAAGVTRGVTGAVTGDADTAFTFSGAADGSAAAGDVSVTCTRDTSYEKVPVCWPPDVFSLETWFKTTTTTGGRLVGWSNRATGNSTKSDRLLYMDDAGRIRFGVKPDDRRIAISSQAGLNDGTWHHVVGTLSPEGMRLYVDGSRVAARGDVTVGEHLSIGTWRLGGDSLQGWPGAPTSAYFAGSLDEVAVYKKELDSSKIGTHYLEGTGGAADGKSSPEASFTKVLDGSGKVLTVDGTGSRDPDGGAITAYSWDFGDGTTATGARPPAHTYAPGRYDVTLTVTDDEGKTGSLTQFVRIMGPPSGTSRISRVLGRTVNADAGLMVDPDGGAIVTYAWNWGDGTPVQSGAVSRPEHEYAADGIYTVTLTTTDDEGESTTSTLPVTVPNLAPVAQGTVAVDGMTVRTDASGSSDPDGTIATYSWSFGQGLPTVQGATAQYTYATPGTYRVRLTVIDDDGVSTRLDQQVTVPGATTPRRPTRRRPTRRRPTRRRPTRRRPRRPRRRRRPHPRRQSPHTRPRPRRRRPVRR